MRNVVVSEWESNIFSLDRVCFIQTGDLAGERELWAMFFPDLTSVTGLNVYPCVLVILQHTQFCGYYFSYS